MYLVIGANGFLGSYVLKNILENTSDTIIATARNIENVISNNRIKWFSCDISDFSQVDSLSAFAADKGELKVIYLAAYHNPDLVEKNPRIAWSINITALSYFLNKIENIKCLFYPSTDSVYGESKGNYHFKETDSLSPVNTYGKQKVLAEKIITGYGYNVVRYPFLIAPSLSPKKKHFYDFIVTELSMGKAVEMFEDSLRSTISFNQAAEMLVRLIENYSDSIPQVLNISGDEDLSKYDVGIRIACKLGIPCEKIIPISVHAGEKIFQAKRAASTLMDNSLIKQLLNQKEIKLEL